MLWLLGLDEGYQSSGRSVGEWTQRGRAWVSANDRCGWREWESGPKLGASVILTSPGVNGDRGPSLLIPDREVTPTLETGLCSKGKTAHTSAQRNPTS